MVWPSPIVQVNLGTVDPFLLKPDIRGLSFTDFTGLPSGYVKKAIENGLVEIVDFPIENGDFPYVKLPEGITLYSKMQQPWGHQSHDNHDISRAEDFSTSGLVLRCSSRDE